MFIEHSWLLILGFSRVFARSIESPDFSSILGTFSRVFSRFLEWLRFRAKAESSRVFLSSLRPVSRDFSSVLSPALENYWEVSSFLEYSRDLSFLEFSWVFSRFLGFSSVLGPFSWVFSRFLEFSWVFSDHFLENSRDFSFSQVFSSILEISRFLEWYRPVFSSILEISQVFSSVLSPFSREFSRVLEFSRDFAFVFPACFLEHSWDFSSVPSPVSREFPRFLEYSRDFSLSQVFLRFLVFSSVLGPFSRVF